MIAQSAAAVHCYGRYAGLNGAAPSDFRLRRHGLRRHEPRLPELRRHELRRHERELRQHELRRPERPTKRTPTSRNVSLSRDDTKKLGQLVQHLFAKTASA